MYGLVEEQETPVSELIERFERDMLYDCHGYALRFSRSQARKELVRLGRRAFWFIVNHLQSHPPGSGMDLDTAWGNLLCMIDADLSGDGPLSLKDTQGWIDWAERTLAKGAPAAG